jgi:beta-phosphoglucomutase-like phosphatase (HAD superfamily)
MIFVHDAIFHIFDAAPIRSAAIFDTTPLVTNTDGRHRAPDVYAHARAPLPMAPLEMSDSRRGARAARRAGACAFLLRRA